MKTLFLLLVLGASTQVAENPPTPSNGTYQLSVKESQVRWQAEYLVGNGHEGTLQFSQGQLSIAENGKKLTGDFKVNMNALKVTDIKEDRSRLDLEEHLKSDDFFSVNRFPWSNFSITRSEWVSPGQYDVTGFLIIKGIFQVVTIPVTIDTSDPERIKAKAQFTIDRTKWNITYQSQTFFSDLKDGVIKDEIRLELDLVFTHELKTKK